MDKVYECSTKYDNPYYPVMLEFIEENEETAKHKWSNYREEAEILVVNYGIIGVQLNSETYEITSGQAFLINMDVPFRLFLKTKSISYYILRFRPEFVIEREQNSSIAERFYSAIDNKSRFNAILLDESNLRDETVLDKINSIIAVNHTKKIGYEIITKGYLCHLWVALLELVLHKQGSFSSISLPTQDELRVKMAIDYLKENYADELTLESIAERIHISRNECCRCFKRVIGIPPIDFLIKLRVYEAAKLIYKDPSQFESISDLAFLVGFNNVSYFNKMFKRTLEITPTQFQRELRNNSSAVMKLYDSLENVINQY